MGGLVLIFCFFGKVQLPHSPSGAWGVGYGGFGAWVAEGLGMGAVTPQMAKLLAVLHRCMPAAQDSDRLPSRLRPDVAMCCRGRVAVLTWAEAPESPPPSPHGIYAQACERRWTMFCLLLLSSFCVLVPLTSTDVP